MASKETFKRLFSWHRHVQSRRPRRVSRHMWWRRTIGATVCLLLIGAIASWFWYFSADERIKAQAIKALEQISGGVVELDGASLEILYQIRIRGLRIYLPEKERHEDNLVFAADDVILRHNPWSILQRRLMVEEIIANGPKLQVWYDRNLKRTNLDFLQPQTQTTTITKLPNIILRGGAIEYFEYIDGESTIRARQNLEGHIYPDPNEQVNGYRFVLSNRGQGALQNVSGFYDLGKKQLFTTGSFLLEMQDFTRQPGRVADWQRLYEISQPQGEVQTESWFDSETGHNFKMILKGGSLKLPVPDVNIPLQNVQAEISFNNNGITIENIIGDYLGFGRFQARGVIEGYNSGAPFDLEIKTEGLTIPPYQWSAVDSAAEAGRDLSTGNYLEYMGPPLGDLLGLLPPLHRQVVRNFSPTGDLDLDLRLRRYFEDEELRTNFLGTLSSQNASISYLRFPYRADGFTGAITFTPNRMIIGPMETNYNGLNIRAVGLWQKEENRASDFNITVKLENLPLDEKLYEALNPLQQKLWNQFQPEGVVNSIYQANLKGAELTHQQLDIDLLDVRGCYEHFPLRTTEIKGHAQWVGDQITFDIYEAKAAQGDYALAGKITQQKTETPQIEGEMTFYDFHLDEQFEAVLPESVLDFYHQTGLRGRVSGKATFRSPSTRLTDEIRSTIEPNQLDVIDLIDLEIAANIQEGRILYEGFPYELNQVTAQVDLNNDELIVHSLVGYHDESQIRLSGQLHRSGEYDLFIHGEPLLFDASLRTAFGGKEFWMWDQLNPDGPAHLTLELERQNSSQTSDGDSQNRYYRAMIEPLKVRLEPAFFQYPLENVSGKIIAEPNFIDIENLTSINGQQQVSLTGDIRLNETAKDYDLHLRATTMALDDQLRDALPDNLRNLWLKYGPGGQLGVHLNIKGQQHEEEGGVWTMEGYTTITEGSLNHPMPAEQIDGEIRGQAQYNSQSKHVNLSAEFLGRSLLLRKRPLNDLTGRVQYNGRQKEMIVDNISSEFCGGRLAGKLSAGFADSDSGYDIKLLFDDIDLSDFMKGESEDSRETNQLKGRCDGRYYILKPSPAERRRGRFSFVVQDAVLGELPIWARLLHVPNLSLPREGAFNEATIKGDIVGEKSLFDMIYLRGSAVALDGMGTMSGPNHDLELVFAIDSPHKLPQIPILTSFFKAIRPELAQVRVTGSFNQPLVEPIAFPSLDEALKMFNPEPEKSSIRR